MATGTAAARVSIKTLRAMKRAALIAVVLALAAPARAEAHSFAIYVSTPISPPAPLAWVRPVSLVAIAVSLILAFRFLGSFRWITSLVVSLGSTLAFSVVFYLIGWFAASANTGPPPGLGPPSAVYVRWSETDLESLFISWNTIGAAVLLAAVFVIGDLWRLGSMSRRLAIVGVPLVVYGVLLLPFVATAAIAHGWAGGYVMNQGNHQIVDLNRACFRYAREHDGRLPVADDIHELLPQIEPYLDDRESPYGNPIYVHPAAWAFAESPKEYVWNKRLSGQPAPELPIESEDYMPVTCPYTGPRPGLLVEIEDDL